VALALSLSAVTAQAADGNPAAPPAAAPPPAAAAPAAGAPSAAAPATGGAAHPATETPVPAMLEEGATASSTQSFDPGFGPRYLIEAVVVRGNHKTKTDLILREIDLHPGDEVSASD